MNENKRSPFYKPPAEDPDEAMIASCAPAGNIFKPDAADLSAIPGKIKVDLSTALENFLLTAAGITAFIAFFLYINGAFDGKKTQANPELLKFVPIALGFMAAAIACWLGTDNYYIINVTKRKLLYHFKIFFIIKITAVADFEEIHAFGVTGVRHTHKGNVWWKYKICAVKNDGEFIDLSNEAGPEKLDELNDRAKGMAAVAGCLFAKGGEWSKLSFDQGSCALNVISFPEECPLSFVETMKELKNIRLSFTFFIIITIIIALFCLMMYFLLTPPV